jgi:hypothetical protein
MAHPHAPLTTPPATEEDTSYCSRLVLHPDSADIYFVLAVGTYPDRNAFAAANGTALTSDVWPDDVLAAHVDDFGDEPRGNERPDAVQVGQGGAGGADRPAICRFSWAASASMVSIRLSRRRHRSARTLSSPEISISAAWTRASSFVAVRGPSVRGGGCAYGRERS